MVERIAVIGLAAAAIEAGISQRTAAKWKSRFVTEGDAGLRDRSSRPHAVRAALNGEQLAEALRLRRARWTIRAIASSLAAPYPTVRRFLAGRSLSRLPPIEAPPPVVRYEHTTPGSMIHLDTKKLGRLEKTGHRITGNKRDHVCCVGWEVLHLAIDDHSRLAYTEVLIDEKKATTTDFLERALAWFTEHGVSTARVMTDNGVSYRSKPFGAALAVRGIRHVFTKPYTPRTNGKAERFVQTALREWAYAHAYNHSSERTDQLARWNHFYNHHRQHSAIGFCPPISRIPMNNVSNLNT
ncbi:IS481 family transposase [Stagnimonas aquatica]|uniref:IS481 family transposase n=1 Tax=Stagnimonas aquatica TaxID=2689987 RepID=A0A3N0VH00_9GAMM|nr:IS481 family transposase [Stagnimonas aquatica]ROH91985.1 IS481 family transposase [Stagnimonas aquatica]